MRYFALVRGSTKKQTMNSQIDAITKRFEQIRKKGDSLTFFEEPNSTTKRYWKKRPVLMSLLETIKKDDTLIIFSVDRLDRTGNDLSHIYNVEFLDRNIKIISICEPDLDYLQESDKKKCREMIHIHCFRAQSERNRIQLRTQAGLISKANRMEMVGKPWFGYEVDPNELQLHNSSGFSFEKPYKLIPHKQEQEAIKIMKECQEQAFTYKEIADVLEQRGYRNRNGNRIHKSTIHRVLKRETDCTQLTA